MNAHSSLMHDYLERRFHYSADFFVKYFFKNVQYIFLHDFRQSVFNIPVRF